MNIAITYGYNLLDENNLSIRVAQNVKRSSRFRLHTLNVLCDSSGSNEHLNILLVKYPTPFAYVVGIQEHSVRNSQLSLLLSVKRRFRQRYSQTPLNPKNVHIISNV